MQLSDWRTSWHAAAIGPGVAGQLAETITSDPQQALACQACYAPLAEQAPFLADAGGVRENPTFDPMLRAKGLPCAGRHVRDRERFGPPRRDGPLASTVPRNTLPHDGVTRTPAFLMSESRGRAAVRLRSVRRWRPRAAHASWSLKRSCR